MERRGCGKQAAWRNCVCGVYVVCVTCLLDVVCACVLIMGLFPSHREKWNLFEESTRVPLIIYHPKSPFRGRSYPLPVEHIDIYPTLLDLAQEPQMHGDTCPPKVGRRRKKICHPLEGQSLVPVLLGSRTALQFQEYSRKNPGSTGSFFPNICNLFEVHVWL